MDFEMNSEMNLEMTLNTPLLDLHCENEVFVVYDENNVPIGKTVTLQEADMFCEKNPTHQWDMSKKFHKYIHLPYVVVSNIFCQYNKNT
jgi:hypothetical protein